MQLRFGEVKKPLNPSEVFKEHVIAMAYLLFLHIENK